MSPMSKTEMSKWVAVVVVVPFQSYANLTSFKERKLFLWSNFSFLLVYIWTFQLTANGGNGNMFPCSMRSFSDHLDLDENEGTGCEKIINHLSAMH